MTYPTDTPAVLLAMYPHATPNMDYRLGVSGGGSIIIEIEYWSAALGQQPTPEQVTAYRDGPEYLAHVRRTRILNLDAERLPRLEAAGWSAADREDALAGLPTPAVTAHLQAERQAVAAAYAAARAAIEAADTIAAVEAINPTWPALTGPDGAQS